MDVVAESHDGEYVLAGECKWSKKPVDAETVLREKITKVSGMPFATGKRIVPILFTRTGPDKKPMDGLYLSADDVLAALRIDDLDNCS